MQARVIFSLGATYPAPPSTCRGMMVKAVAATPPVTMNWRRERLRGGDGLLVSLVSLGCDSLVFMRKRIYHVDIGVHARMKDKPHQFPRRSICWSSCSNDMPEDGS